MIPFRQFITGLAVVHLLRTSFGRIALGAWLLGLLLVGCTDSVLVHRYEPVSDRGWVRTDTLCFFLPSASQTGDYILSLGMRHTSVFPYEGIWVVVETQLHRPSALLTDTLYFQAYDDQGVSLSQGVNLLQREVPLRCLHLRCGQSGTVRLRHIMTRETIPAIREMGIRMERK